MKHAINLAELLQPKSKRRAEARAIEAPPVRTRCREGATCDEAQCPSCGAWRPAHCISMTPSGLLGDCCISAIGRALTVPGERSVA